MMPAFCAGPLTSTSLMIADVENSLELLFPTVIPIEIFSLLSDKAIDEILINRKKIKKQNFDNFFILDASKKIILSHFVLSNFNLLITQEINQVSHYIYSVRQKVLQKGHRMTLKQYIVAGVVEQAIVLGFILPATGWWFSFFALSAVWNLVAGGLRK